MRSTNHIPGVFIFFAVFIVVLGLLILVNRVGATPNDDGQYIVRYVQGGDSLWRMDLSGNHPFEIARLGVPFELEQGFTCQHEAVNHFYSLFARLNRIALLPFPPPPGGC